MKPIQKSKTEGLISWLALLLSTVVVVAAEQRKDSFVIRSLCLVAAVSRALYSCGASEQLFNRKIRK
jgi:hypothetical protein